MDTIDAEGEYLTPQRQPQNPQMSIYEAHMTPERNVDELTEIRQQRPDVLREVYPDSWDNQYRHLHNRQTIDWSSAVYHDDETSVIVLEQVTCGILNL